MDCQSSVNTTDTPLVLGTKTIAGRLVIPSGIRCTRASTIDWCFANVPAVGVVTTKSISLAPRAGYREPIYARYAPHSYINAVGLTNPGAEQFRRELEQIRIPTDKFLLVSIFGGNAKQFVDAARELRTVADGFELNMSCPHAEGYGVEIGQSRELVAQITAAVVEATRLPVVVKLSAVVGDVGQIAKAAIGAGAAGITVSNTIGPATVNLGIKPILSNRVGGLSGASIQPLALRGVARVRDAIGPGPLIIGMGGIFTADDIRQFRNAGADLFGVGSALTGMDSEMMQGYLEELTATQPAQPQEHYHFPELTMDYQPAKLVGREDYYPGLFKLIFDRLPIEGRPGELAGKYFFLFEPGFGEKPFAIFSAQEKSILIKSVGNFTEHLAHLPVGSTLYLRGPYGKPFPAVTGRTVVLAGGGTGIASLFEIGKLLEKKNELHFLLGGRSAKDLFDLDKFSKLGAVQVSTNDGSQGAKGFVSDLLAAWRPGPASPEPKRPLYVICGPEPMVEACFKLLAPVAEPDDICGAIEYITSCGVGICGKCASPNGALTCIDGPFMTYPFFLPRK